MGRSLVRPALLVLGGLYGGPLHAQDAIRIDVTSTISDVSCRPFGINLNFLLDDDENRPAALKKLARDCGRQASNTSATLAVKRLTVISGRFHLTHRPFQHWRDGRPVSGPTTPSGLHTIARWWSTTASRSEPRESGSAAIWLDAEIVVRRGQEILRWTSRCGNSYEACDSCRC